MFTIFVKCYGNRMMPSFTARTAIIVESDLCLPEKAPGRRVAK